MKAQLKVLSGFNAGLLAVFSKPYIAIGRHPASDVRFDAEKELDVSARHAALLKQGKAWFLRDLGSRNGTLVNGHRITKDLKLDDTDQIRLGANGPTVEFRLVSDATPDAVTAPRPAAGTQPSPVDAVPSLRDTLGGSSRPTAGARPSNTQRIRAEVRRQTKGLRTLTTILVAMLLVAVGAFVVVNRRQALAREREARAMQARIDSVLAASEAAVQSLKGEVAGLADALHRSQAEVQRLNNDLASASASGDARQIEALRARLNTAADALRTQQIAAQVDYSAIYQDNQDAVAMIYVEFAPGEVFTGTAFAITREGVLITNRHVVAGPDGTRKATKVGIKFADSDQVFPARVLAIGQDKAADVAVVKVDIRGGNPAIKTFRPSASVRPGDPVAVIGFPLGVELPTDQRGYRQVARTSLTAGTVSKVLDDLVQVDGYGAEGSSGSPIFDGAGNVVAVLYGGQPGTGGRIVFGVPVSYAQQLAQPYLSGHQN